MNSSLGNGGNSRGASERYFITFLCVIIIASAWAAIYSIEREEKASLEKTLITFLETSRNNISSRLLAQKKSVSTWASYAPLRSIAIELQSLQEDATILIESEPQKRLRQLMTPVDDAVGYRGYFIISKNHINLASSRDENIGVKNLLSLNPNLLNRAFSGNTVFSLPQASDVPLEDIYGNMVEDLPTMFVAAPVRDFNNEIIAIFALRLEPDESFGPMFKTSRFGGSGETYAFDADGLLISESRFQDQLVEIGLIEGNHSDLAIYIRDPGVNLTLGKTSSTARYQQSLTTMAESATKGNNGTNLEGYNDYRGVPVVGAWLWDQELGFGMTTEFDVDEAYSTFNNTRFTIIIFTSLSLGVLLAFVIRSSMSRASLAAAEKKYRNTINSTTEGYWLIDTQGQVLEVNSALCQMLGYEPKEMIGRHFWEFLTDAGKEQLGASIEDTLSNLKSTLHRHYVLDFMSKQGKILHLHVNATSITNDNNIATGAFAFITDTTELENARIDANKAKVTADNANKAKSEFLSSMSHELRTPLNAIIGFGQLLAFDPKGTLSEKQKDQIQQIMNGGNHLIELINEILDLAQIESGEIQLQIEDVSLSELLNDCQLSLDVLANSRGIDIHIDDVKEDQFICADNLRIKQVLINLISNAIKYNRDNGTVTISSEEMTKDILRINVSDTGHGIPENKLSELFKPFSRLGAELTGVEGTGIGLVVCTDLVTLMGGTIGVESSVGEGSTFWIEMPSAHPIKNSVEANSELPDTIDKTLPTIEGTVLYVEDNPANISLLEALIGSIDGLHLSIAQTGVEGIKMARTISPDIIILDINLPDMSGYDILKELRQYEETKIIPTLAMSAAATKDDIEKGMAAGFQQYITKPINIPEVIEVIQNTVERGSSSSE